MNTIAIYTDGSCLGNPGPGGWAVLVVQEEEGSGKNSKEMKEIVVKGGEKMTTNNIMELTAAIQALKWVWEQKTGKIWQWMDSDVQENLFADYEKQKIPLFTPVIVDQSIHLITDSNYVKLGITERMITRKRRQRRRAKGGKLVENVDLRKELDALAACFSNLHWQRTKAHVGTEMNERVDQLARMEAGK